MFKRSFLAFVLLFSINGYAKNVLFYDFEDNDVNDTVGATVVDKSGFNNIGNFHNGSSKGAVIVAPGADGSKRAVELNGEPDKYDFVYAKDSKSLSITGDLTISTWIYNRSSDPDKVSGVITKTYKSDTHEVEYWVGIYQNHIQYYDNAGNDINVDTFTFDANKWYYIAVTRNIKDKTMKFYVDGKLVKTVKNIETGIKDTDYGLSIGSCIPCYAPFNGKIDCPRIHDNVLSDKEIVTDKDSCKPKACLGDRVWLDDGDGIQNSDEIGLKDVNVTLLDKDGNYLNSMLTDSNGTYKFCNLSEGKYKIKVTTPNGYEITNKDQGRDDSKDSDVDINSGISDLINFSATADDFKWDIGLVEKPTPTYCLGDFVWEDKNANGIQDSGENGVAGVSVKLYDANGVELNKTTTNSGGEYEFCGLEAGKYSVEFVKSTLPKGYEFTKVNQGNSDSKDSDANKTTGKTDMVEITNSDINSVDAGIVKKPTPTYCLGDFVWEDKNANGIQDSGESGIAGVTVKLYNTNGVELKSVTTNGSGKYEFCGLSNGDYVVEVIKPKDYEITKANQGSNDSRDSDVNPATGKTSAVTINNANNSSVDAGLIKKDDNSDNDGANTKGICLGDYVWYDKNLNGVQDEKELGVVDVPVYIYDANGNSVKDIDGNVVKAIKTDKSGHYKFCNLTPGKDYKIKVDIPDTYMATQMNMGSDLKDSDINSNGEIFVKSPTKDNMSLDAGIYCECDDYKVHPKNYKKVSAPSFSFVGFAMAFFAIFLLATRREKR